MDSIQLFCLFVAMRKFPRSLGCHVVFPEHLRIPNHGIVAWVFRANVDLHAVQHLEFQFI